MNWIIEAHLQVLDRRILYRPQTYLTFQKNFWDKRISIRFLEIENIVQAFRSFGNNVNRSFFKVVFHI